MSLFNLKPKMVTDSVNPNVESFLQGYSIEVMPRTAAKVEDFRALLPSGTRVYIAHIDGTPIDDMVETAKRITDEGYDVMPHFPARIIKDRATLENWISRYANEAGVKQALLLAGGLDAPQGDFETSMQLLETGLFDRAGFTNLHVAGHPEGNRDIDPDGTRKNVDAALSWKQEFSKRTHAKMAIATQFCFESEPVIEWANNLVAQGIDIPVHIGIAGPAKLQTMVKFAIACGVGPSLRVLQRRAKDVTKLMLPFEPNDIITELADHKAANPDFNIAQVHFFPLGGIKTNATWAMTHGGASGVPAVQS
ncbi:5,10-methylenetetrahydrofolate reductase [Amylibacter kogurei]|uniref:5,10-methylenetetrahydrofolate reductase n=1 Tax=Paramylibacter kogurei TaxID=1889778 RepID=A0A2G5K6X0_9RHOB|nr:5,10-methylenetetrahydrofolate reductase [Amylibacter kogurei]PIB24859.1 5,10-methylenetetrahydrofolate reductase [Amylibacter kogurei]